MIEIPGVPASIPLSKVLEFVESLDIDAKYCRSVYVSMNTVQVKILALDRTGHIFAELDDEPACHTIIIKLDKNA